ncbi:MAG: TetR/AcrR family transcriptional regulator [Christensenellaceae bacterium]|nr:TetR/AcrR family transcriptional regulator [Christensenellaceae bacterium]
MNKDFNQNTDVDVKENIIDATTELIQKSNGNLDQVTIRNIANKAGVSIGLINYYFESKKKLIEICVERIIKQIIFSFKFNQEINDKPKDKLLSGTISVFKFLKENPEIVKVSILSDLSSPNMNTNSVTSFKGIINALPDSFPKDKKNVVAFMLLSTIQSAFLLRNVTKDLLDFDLYTDEGIQSFFQYVIDLLFAPDLLTD